ncbi:S1 family peptidase [Candidatus Poriferisodalis sp.]|uniref:S1 family peptidase n=1 Tax=Candidatus Poriferisodalis sp. TaxID=3101277 RepID=UPI003D0B620F
MRQQQRRPWVAGAALFVATSLTGCGADFDDSGSGGEPVERVVSIRSSAGPLWLGAPPVISPIGDDVLAGVSDGVVAVRALGCGPTSNGTAFAVAPGLLVGAAHVVTGASSVEVGSLGDDVNNPSPDHAATVVGFDPDRDLALLRSDMRVTALPMSRARIGAEGVVLGYPAGKELTASPARVEHFVRATGLWGTDNVRNVYVLAADVRTGQSGAPLLDSDGNVIGIAFAQLRGSAEVAFALSRGELLNFLVESGVDARIDYLGRTVINARRDDLSATPNGECGGG